MDTPATTRVFLSCVSSEFKSYRLRLANQLGAIRGRPFEVKTQEDFQQGGFTLLGALADYVRECDLVIHLVGDAAGARPSADHERALFQHWGEPPPELLPGWSFTQWEYRLARRFQKRRFVYLAQPETPRDGGVPIRQSDDDARLQQTHREHIDNFGEHWKSFAGHHQLVREVFHDLGLEPSRKVDNISRQFKSLGTLFKGRDEFLEQIRTTLGQVEHQGHLRAAAITANATAAAVHGLGGIGKTRAAVKFAIQHADEYTALLFMTADSPGSLQQNLAALCGPLVLDLAEKDRREVEVQMTAVLRWLQQHPGWFLILDNVDTEEAACAVEDLLGQLQSSGQVLVTSQISDWSGAVETLALNVLAEADAADFLLERTDRDTGRSKMPDDAEQARRLAVELGQLALALEQAGAYICRQRLSFTEYLTEWRVQHDQVLEWFNERLMRYPKSVAVTWQTSFNQLSDPARRLLHRLAWLAPDPIPKSLLDVPQPINPTRERGTERSNVSNFSLGRQAWNHFSSLIGKVRPNVLNPSLAHRASVATASSTAEPGPDLREALADLETYSLATRDGDSPTFAVHRLVQDVTRRSLRDDPEHHALTEALHWIAAAFVSNQPDVRSGPMLDPLFPHARAAAAHADHAAIAEPTALLMSVLGLLLFTKALYAEAESLMRRALAIDEQSLGDQHPNVARDLNNLAELLRATNRLAEAEPLMRHALAIDEQSFGHQHHNITLSLNNLAQLLQDTNRLAEAEPLMRRALAIDEQSFGNQHPKVANSLSNLAQLLQATNRPTEAEPLMRRALAIAEQSFGDQHPAVARDLNNLALLLKDTNRLAEAEPLMRRALAIDEQSFGDQHPKVAIRLNNLAALLQATHRLAEAEPLMRRALAIDKQSFGDQHLNVAIRLNNLAQLLQDTNRLIEAERLMRQTLMIFESFTSRTGHEHPHLQGAFGNYVALLRAIGKTDAEIQSILESLLQSDE